MNPSNPSIFDASPLLHLARLEALDWFEDDHWVIAPESVLDELTGDPYREGAPEILHAMELGWIRLRTPDEPLHPEDMGLGLGESDCLRLFREHRGREIVTDDARFGRHLSRNLIPFRNTPLWLADRLASGRMDRRRGVDGLRRLRETGIWPPEVWA